MNRYWKDAGITITILVLAALFAVQAIGFLDVKASSVDPGAGFWPLISLGIIIFFGLLNLVSIYSQIRTEGDSVSNDVQTETTKETDIDKTNNRKAYLSTIGLLLIYVSLLDTVGFVSLTPFFLILLAWNNGYRDVVKLLLFGPLVSVILQIAFRNFFNIALPRGIGIFREVSLFFESLI